MSLKNIVIFHKHTPETLLAVYAAWGCYAWTISAVCFLMGVEIEYYKRDQHDRIPNEIS